MRGKCEWGFNATTTIGEVAKTFQVAEIPTKLFAIALVFGDIAKKEYSVHFLALLMLTLLQRAQYERTLMVCSHCPKMDCIELCGGGHTAQRRTPTQILIELHANLSVFMPVPVSVYVLVSGSVNRPEDISINRTIELYEKYYRIALRDRRGWCLRPVVTLERRTWRTYPPRTCSVCATFTTENTQQKIPVNF